MFRSTLFILLSVLSIGLYSQGNSLIGFEGQVFFGENKEKATDKGEGVSITLFQGNTTISEYTTTRNGKFVLDLERNKYYIVEFKRDNYVTKRIIIKTKIPSSSKIPKKDFEFEVFLLKEVEGVNYSRLDFPMAIIEFQKPSEKFDYDTEYTDARDKEQEEIIKKGPTMASNWIPSSIVLYRGSFCLIIILLQNSNRLASKSNHPIYA